MIIGKTNIEQSNYDCFVLCVRNVLRIKIPNFIEHICSCSFNFCEQLIIIEIPNDSKLKTIGEIAFANTKIKNIKIPSSVTSIGKCAFNNCTLLKSVEIPDDSELQTIGIKAFSLTAIESIRKRMVFYWKFYKNLS